MSYGDTAPPGSLAWWQVNAKTKIGRAWKIEVVSAKATTSPRQFVLWMWVHSTEGVSEVKLSKGTAVRDYYSREICDPSSVRLSCVRISVMPPTVRSVS